MEYLVIFVVGVIVGAIIVLFMNRFRQRDIEKSFSALSFDALRKNSEEFLRLANQTLSAQTQIGAGTLDEKKKLIDQTLDGIKSELARVEKSVVIFDTNRAQTFGCNSGFNNIYGEAGWNYSNGAGVLFYPGTD